MADARLVFRREVSSQRVLVRIAREDGGRFVFTPGQHLTVTFANGVRLPYSIASAPGLAYVELYVSLIEPWPEQGSLLELSEPAGTFTLDGVPDNARLLFIASGSGVAPFVSMLRTYLPRRAHSALIQGSRSAEELAFSEELEAMDGLIYRPTLTQAADTWPGLRGRVQPWLAEALREFSDAHVFLCGHAPMIEEGRGLAVAQGFDVARIHAEFY